MIYNPQLPIAVFLGPSLERGNAYRILAANYYPPARLGDIYRLIGSGVRTIVLIDGIFHSAAAIWQREILEALDNHIMVVGAASMGALRAAELYPFGMIGHGVIFQWYCDAVITGDDEVALLHADESLMFQCLSEPLVNIRSTLLEAVNQHILSKQQCRELTEFAKKMYYGDRSYAALVHSPVVGNWPQPVQARLVQFIQQSSHNLKRQDAISALKFSATLQKAEDGGRIFPLPLRHRGDYYGIVRYSYRGFYHSTGYLVRGKHLLAEVMKRTTLLNELRGELAKNYFLGLWIKQQSICAPVAYCALYQRQWEDKYVSGEIDQWLRCNGLTKQEFQALVAERAQLAWLVEQGPAFLGIDFTPYNHFADRLLTRIEKHDHVVITSAGEQAKTDPRVALLKQLMEICYLAAWAVDNGITYPRETTIQFIAKWEAHWQISNRLSWLAENNMSEVVYSALLAKWACYDWLITKGPVYFGYTTWSFERALIQELQVSGQAGQLLEKLDGHALSIE